MIKPQSLRDHLTAALPELRNDPDRLLVIIERGNVVSTLAPGASFEYSYVLSLVVTDFGGHPDALMVPLLDWVRVHQSELLANPNRRDQIAFEAEVMANDKVDVQITLPLTERVGVHRDASGDVTIEHYGEPPYEEAVFEADSWRLYLDGEVAAEWNTPHG